MSFSKQVLENPIKRMGGKNLWQTSEELLLMKHSSAPHCFLVVDTREEKPSEKRKKQEMPDVETKWFFC